MIQLRCMHSIVNFSQFHKAGWVFACTRNSHHLQIKSQNFKFDSLTFCGDPETWLITRIASSIETHDSYMTFLLCSHISRMEMIVKTINQLNYNFLKTRFFCCNINTPNFCPCMHLRNNSASQVQLEIGGLCLAAAGKWWAPRLGTRFSTVACS